MPEIEKPTALNCVTKWVKSTVGISVTKKLAPIRISAEVVLDDLFL